MEYYYHQKQEVEPQPVFVTITKPQVQTVGEPLCFRVAVVMVRFAASLSFLRIMRPRIRLRLSAFASALKRKAKSK